MEGAPPKKCRRIFFPLHFTTRLAQIGPPVNVPLLIGFLFRLRKKGPAFLPSGCPSVFPFRYQKSVKNPFGSTPHGFLLIKLIRAYSFPLGKSKKHGGRGYFKNVLVVRRQKVLLNFLNPFYGARRARFQEIQLAPHAEHRHAALFPLGKIIFIACNDAALFPSPDSFERRLFDGRKYLRRVIVRQTTEVTG